MTHPAGRERVPIELFILETAQDSFYHTAHPVEQTSCLIYLGPSLDQVKASGEHDGRKHPTAEFQRLPYRLEIGQEQGRPQVFREILRYKRGVSGRPFHFLDFTKGIGFAITNEEDFKNPDQELGPVDIR